MPSFLKYQNVETTSFPKNILEKRRIVAERVKTLILNHKNSRWEPIKLIVSFQQYTITRVYSCKYKQQCLLFYTPSVCGHIYPLSVCFAFFPNLCRLLPTQNQVNVFRGLFLLWFSFECIVVNTHCIVDCIVGNSATALTATYDTTGVNFGQKLCTMA